MIPQDGPDAPAESGPISAKPSIGPEDFLPPEPVPRTTRSRAKASTVVPATAMDSPSPMKGKSAVRGKAKETQQQQQPAEQVPPKTSTQPFTSPKAGKGKAAAPQASGKGAQSAKGKATSVGKAGEGSGREQEVPASVSADEADQQPKAGSGRSRGSAKLASSPRQDARGKGSAVASPELPKSYGFNEAEQEVVHEKIQLTTGAYFVCISYKDVLVAVICFLVVLFFLENCHVRKMHGKALPGCLCNGTQMQQRSIVRQQRLNRSQR